jgi:hypothetical protein
MEYNNGTTLALLVSLSLSLFLVSQIEKERGKGYLTDIPL